MLKSVTLAVVGAAVLCTEPASAAPDFTLTFAPVGYSVRTSGTVDFYATLANSGDLTFVSVSGEGETSNPGFNNVGFAFPSLGGGLKPGESLMFDFGTLNFSGLIPGETYYPVASANLILELPFGAGILYRASSNVPVLTAVPEPTSWATMLAGFAAIRLDLRRRRHIEVRPKSSGKAYS